MNNIEHAYFIKWEEQMQSEGPVVCIAKHSVGVYNLYALADFIEDKKNVTVKLLY